MITEFTENLGMAAASTCNPRDGEWQEVYVGGRKRKDMAEIRPIQGTRSWPAFPDYCSRFLSTYSCTDKLTACTYMNEVNFYSSRSSFQVWGYNGQLLIIQAALTEVSDIGPRPGPESLQATRGAFLYKRSAMACGWQMIYLTAV